MSDHPVTQSMVVSIWARANRSLHSCHHLLILFRCPVVLISGVKLVSKAWRGTAPRVGRGQTRSSPSPGNSCPSSQPGTPQPDASVSSTCSSPIPSPSPFAPPFILPRLPQEPEEEDETQSSSGAEGVSLLVCGCDESLLNKRKSAVKYAGVSDGLSQSQDPYGCSSSVSSFRALSCLIHDIFSFFVHVCLVSMALLYAFPHIFASHPCACLFFHFHVTISRLDHRHGPPASASVYTRRARESRRAFHVVRDHMAVACRASVRATAIQTCIVAHGSARLRAMDQRYFFFNIGNTSMLWLSPSELYCLIAQHKGRRLMSLRLCSRYDRSHYDRARLSSERPCIECSAHIQVQRY